jgi:uncharacterized protein (DUF488 family)
MFTIGYATKPINTYIQQLQQHGITVVADIRSVPYSKVFFDYHQQALKQHLQQAGLRYVYLGDELGPRSKDPAHYDDSQQVQFDRLMQAPLYQAGVQRLFDGVEKGFRIAMTCACKDPAICHRSLLVGWSLRHQYDCELQHITHDGALESQTALEQRLMTLTDTVPDLLAGEAAALQLAYQQQCRACAYRRPVAG